MSLTKRDFEILARELSTTRPYPTEDKRYQTQWEQDREAIADACAKSNPRFNRDQFYKACEQ